MKRYTKLKKRIAMTTAVSLAVGSSLALAACGENHTPDSYAAEEPETEPVQAEGTQAGEEKAMGRYLETDLTLPDGCSYVEGLEYLKDGSLRVCYMNSEYELFYADSKDNGETWGDAVSLAELFGLDPDQFSVSYPKLSSDGGFFAMITEYSNEDPYDYEMFYYYADQEGNVRQIKPEGLGEDVYVTNSEFTDNDTILLNTFDGIMEVSLADDSVVTVYEKGNFVTYFGLTGHYLLAVVDGSIHYYDVDTGKPAEEQEALSSQISSNKENLEITSTTSFPLLVLEGDEEDSLFYVDGTGMYRYAFGGSVVEQIIDGSLNSIGSPDTALVDMAKDSNGRFYLAVTANSEGKILRYEYSTEVAAVPDTELKVYSLTDNDFIRQAAAAFQKKYPDIYVSLEVGMTGEDAVTTTDALKTLNTEIMAGKGPDVLILDGIPQETYVEKGMLEDLSGILMETDETDGILDNIMDAYTNEDGTIYYMPLKFAIPMIVGEKADVERITDLTALADVIEEHQEEYGENRMPTALSYLPETVLRGLAEVYAGDWLKEDGTLDETAIAEYLTETRRIYQASSDAASQFIESAESSTGIGQESIFSELRGIQIGVGTDSSQVLMGSLLLSLGGLYSPSDLAIMISSEESNSSLAHVIWGEADRNCFLPLQTFGICSKAGEKEAAEKFAEFLFSQEGQAIGTTEGLPVNQTLYDSIDYWMLGEEGSELWTWGSSNSQTGEMIEGVVRQPSKEVITQIQELGKTLEAPSSVNEFILSAVEDGGAGYLRGESSLDEAVNAILQEVNLYLSE